MAYLNYGYEVRIQQDGMLDPNSLHTNQWIRYLSGSSQGIEIRGETGETYVIQHDDHACRIRLKQTFESGEELWSNLLYVTTTAPPQPITDELYFISGTDLTFNIELSSAGDIVHPNGTKTRINRGVKTKYICNQIGTYKLPVSNMTHLDFTNQRAHEFDFCDHFYTGKLKTLFYAFANCFEFNGNVANWDVRNVPNANACFRACKKFNGDVSKWDVSNINTFTEMFRECFVFNSDVSNWNVSKSTSFWSMFSQCKVFNQDVGKWDIGGDPGVLRVLMDTMFGGCEEFDQDISDWNMTKTGGIETMFSDAHKFNQPIGKWELTYSGGVGSLRQVFRNAHAFNQDISSWNTVNAKSIFGMFQDAKSFNQDLSGWRFNNLQNMEWFAIRATNFESDLSNWCCHNEPDERRPPFDGSAMEGKTHLYPKFGNCP